MPLSDDAIKAMRAESPFYIETNLPARTYPGQSESAKTSAAVAMAITNKNTADENVDRFFQAWEAQLKPIQQETRAHCTRFPIGLKTGLSIPLHPAAEKYVGNDRDAPS